MSKPTLSDILEDLQNSNVSRAYPDTAAFERAEAAIATAIREAMPKKYTNSQVKYYGGNAYRPGYNAAIDDYQASLTARLGIDTKLPTSSKNVKADERLES
jgi:hypothetical protein